MPAAVIPHKPNSRLAGDIDESPFQHRTAYPPGALWELACSIRDVGVKEDCLARPHPNGPSRLELVYGHRRRRASILAVLIAEGLVRDEYDRLRAAEPDRLTAMLDEAASRAPVPVTVREMSDEEVLEEQGRENFQRAQPNAMEVALYLDTLMRPRPEGLGYTLDQVLAKTRKERAWVVKHLKLLGLSPKVREALLVHEELTEDYAFEIARLTSHPVQEAALDMILMTDGESEEDDDVRVLSLPDARRLIRQRFMLRLVDAPFETGNAALVAGRGACGSCPERTGNQQGLFGDVNDDAVCTNVECFNAKAHAQFHADATTADVTVIPEAEVKQLYPHGHLSYSSGCVELDAAAPWDVLRKAASWREILGTNVPPVSWAWVPGRGKVELVRAADVQKIVEPMLREARSAAAKQRAADPDAQKVRLQEAEARRQRELQNATNLRAMQAVVGAWPDSPSVEMLADLARTALRSCWADTLADVVRVLGLEDKLHKSPRGGFKSGHEEALLEHIGGLKKKRELLGFLACLMYSRGLTATYDASATERLKGLCSRVRVDFGEIERDVRAEASKPKAAKTKAAPTSTSGKRRAKGNKESPAAGSLSAAA